MKEFLKNILMALLPVIIINLVCFSTLLILTVYDDLTYVNYASALDKERRLDSLASVPRLVIIGGSNTRFGYCGNILKDSLGINPVNMGIHIGLGLDYMLDEVENKIKPGDILLISAEYQHYISIKSYKGDEGLTDMYLIRHRYMDALTHIVNTHNFLSVYRLIRKRMKRMGMKPEDIPESMEVRTKYNEYGDYIGHYGLPSRSFSISRLQTTPDETVLDDLAVRVQRLKNRGVDVMFMPPPYCMSAYVLDSATINRLSEHMSEKGMPFYMDPKSCVYPDSMYYDTQYHLTRDGAVRHTCNVVNVIHNNIR